MSVICSNRIFFSREPIRPVQSWSVTKSSSSESPVITSGITSGAVIMPANPGFYLRPQTVSEIVDFMVARVLDHLGVTHSLCERWGNER